MSGPMFIFGGDTGVKSPEELKRLRSIAMALQPQTAPKNVGEGLNSIGQAIAFRMMMNRADSAEAAGRQGAAATLNPIYAALSGQASSKPAMTPAQALNKPPSSSSTPSAPTAASGPSALPGSFLSALDKYEGGGSYDTLFGHAQRDGGRFAGTRVSEMPISDVMAFSDPGGAYAQSVKGQIGRVATPMGRHQIVGKTLRNAVSDMGIDPSTPFNQQTQDGIAAHLAQRRIQSAGTMEGKIAALRSEWEGFKNVPYSEMAQIVTDLSSPNAFAGTAPAMSAQAEPVMDTASARVMSAFNAQPDAPQMASMDQLRSGQPMALSGASPSQSGQDVLTAAFGPPQGLPAAQQAMPDPQGGGQQNPFDAMYPMAGGSQNLGQRPGQFPGAPQIVADASGQFPPPPQQGAALSLPNLYRALQDPWLSEEQRAFVTGQIQRIEQEQDPLRQLQIQKMQREIASPQKNWQKLDDNTLFDPSSGEVKQVGQTPGNGQFRFGGTSVEAQSLNGLMDAGKLTPEQAQQLGAGKTISGPNGEILFMTPQGVFGQSGQGAAPQPVAPQQGLQPQAQPSPTAPQQQSQAAPSQPAAPTGSRPGMIALTEPKQTVDEKAAAGFADRLYEAQAAIDGAGASTGQDWWGNIVAQNPWIPDMMESSLMSGDFQAYDQARRNFINAQLRRESGAVISDSEFANANQQYFPQPGDTEEQVKRKRAARETALNAMRRSAGPTYRTPAGGGGGQTSGGVSWRIEN